MKEADTQRAVQIAATKEGWRLFRNNVGTGWVGRGQPEVNRNAHPITVTLYPGDAVLRGPVRPFHAGLCTGSGDLIGWVPAVFDGCRVAVLTSAEIKSRTGRLTVDQANWGDQVRLAGGIAVTARSPEQAIQEIKAALVNLGAK